MNAAATAIICASITELATLGAGVYLGRLLVTRLAAPKQTPGKSGNGTTTATAAGRPGAKTETPSDDATVTPITETEGAKAA